jgi:hypothetical protein
MYQRLISAGTLALLLTACATAPSQRCASGEQLMIEDTLYFGTAMPGDTVSAEQWAEFLARAVTPHFPQGLTVWPASGQWRSPDGTIVHEASYVLRLFHPDNEPSETAIRAAMDEYKSRFEQDAVLRVKKQACTSF